MVYDRGWSHFPVLLLFLYHTLCHFDMLSCRLVAGFLLLLALSTVAQVPSSSWRKASMTTSPADRVSLASAAIEMARTKVGSDGQFSSEGYAVAGTFYSQMAEFDIVTTGTRYQQELLQYLNLAQSHNRVNFSDGLTYGYAAARGYAAYNVTQFLQFAVQSWWLGRKYTLSQADIDAATIPTKNFSVQQLCEDITMAGGTFYKTVPNDKQIVGLSTGYFALVSARLAEATSDPTYLQAAQESTDFIHAHLYNIQNVVQDSISAAASDSCAVSSPIEPYNSGLMIEALAVLASITQNSTTQALLGTILEAAIENSAWQESDGIISNTGHGSEGDISLVRGLSATYSLNVTTPAMRTYITDYLAVQFNAAIDLSTSGDNIYGAAWIGPPSGLAATSSIDPFTETSSFPPTTVSAPTSSTKGHPTKFHRKYGPPSSATGPSVSTTDATLSNQADQRRADAAAPSSSTLPTEELVRVLNERLRNRQWDEEEAPPEYPVA
ncbi:hypothetical protein C8R43DRAFT_1190492 [Mycena crocata]|nr:hypothetical protein C8R43DRAFT_1190492 [Mycena crocata]